MKFLTKMKDGGPDSPVDAYVLFESKRFGSIMLLKFNKGQSKFFHSHAFHALTWFLGGRLQEVDFFDDVYEYSRSLVPKLTPKQLMHRVVATETSWCLTIRGPWENYWYEWRGFKRVKLGWGRVEY